MDTLTISAASGMRARLESLDMLANNLANAETGGYKTDREFYNLFVSADASAGPADAAAALPVVERPWTDFSQGLIHPTGGPLDIAISGQGFLAVNGPAGNLYTRNGSLRVSPTGTLVTTAGYPLRTVTGAELQIQPGGAPVIAADGTVLQEGQPLGRLAIVEFPETASLVKQGASYFRTAAESQPASTATLEQGELEGSNVAPSESAVRLVSVMRQFEMLQKAATLGSQMNREVVEEVAKVAS